MRTIHKTDSLSLKKSQSPQPKKRIIIDIDTINNLSNNDAALFNAMLLKNEIENKNKVKGDPTKIKGYIQNMIYPFENVEFVFQCHLSQQKISIPEINHTEYSYKLCKNEKLVGQGHFGVVLSERAKVSHSPTANRMVCKELTKNQLGNTGKVIKIQQIENIQTSDPNKPLAIELATYKEISAEKKQAIKDELAITSMLPYTKSKKLASQSMQEEKVMSDNLQHIHATNYYYMEMNHLPGIPAIPGTL